MVSLTDALRGFLQDMSAPIIPATVYSELVYTAQGTVRLQYFITCHIYPCRTFWFYGRGVRIISVSIHFHCLGLEAEISDRHITWPEVCGQPNITPICDCLKLWSLICCYISLLSFGKDFHQILACRDLLTLRHKSTFVYCLLVFGWSRGQGFHTKLGKTFLHRSCIVHVSDVDVETGKDCPQMVGTKLEAHFYPEYDCMLQH